MNKRFSKLVATLLVSAMILSAMPFIMPAKAAPPLPPAFWIMPQTEAFDTNTASVGTRFNVTAWVATTAAQSYDWQAAIYYDFTYLNNTGVWMSAPGNGMSNWFFTNGVVNTVYNGYNIATGNDLGLNYTLVGESLKAGAPGPQFIPPSSGTLFIAEFEIMSAPAPGNTLTSLIQFSPPGAVWSSIVDDPQGNTELGFSFGSCAYSFAWIAPGAITPMIVNATTNYFSMFTNWVGATFDEVVEFTGVSSAWGMTNATTNFLYNGTLLAVTNVVFDPMWGTTSTVGSVSGDEFLFAANPTPLDPSGTVVLATVTFQILNQGIVPPEPYGHYDASVRTLSGTSAYSRYATILTPITMNPQPATPDIWVFAYLTAAPPYLCITGATLGPNPSYGATFTVDVTLNGVSEPSQHLIGVQYRVLYDSSILNAILVTEGPYFQYWATQEALGGHPPASYPTGTFFATFFNDSEGTYGDNVLVGQMIYPDDTGVWNEPLPNGTGVIATITFQVIAPISYGEQNITTLLSFATDSSMEAIGLDNLVNQNVVDVTLGPPCTSTVTITWNWPGRMIDLYGGAVNSGMIALDDQPIPQFVPPYGGQGPNAPMDLVEPQSWVYLNANVTYNYFPVQHKNVAFEVVEPDGQTVYTKMTAFTDDFGVASVGFRMPWPCVDPESLFGIWHVTATVQLADVTINDTMDYKYNWIVNIFKVTTDAYQYAHPGNTAGLPTCVQITFDYGSLAMQTYPALFVIRIVDNLGVTVGIAAVETTVGGAVYCTWANGSATVEICLPKWAYAGIATIYIDGFNFEPSQGGVAITPEWAGPTIAIQPY